MYKQFTSIGVHWYSRKATLNECSELLLLFLEQLKFHNQMLFGQWYRKAKSKKKALESPLVLDYSGIKKLLSKGGKDDAYPEVSYSAGIWNGSSNDGEMITLSVSLGSAEEKYFTNNCVLELPTEGTGFEYYQSEYSQKKLIDILKQVWEPEWAIVDGERVVLQ